MDLLVQGNSFVIPESRGTKFTYTPDRWPLVQTCDVKHIPTICWTLPYCSIAFAMICYYSWSAPDAILRTSDKWETCCPDSNIGKQSSLSKKSNKGKAFHASVLLVDQRCHCCFTFHVLKPVAEWSYYIAKSVRLFPKLSVILAAIMIQSLQQHYLLLIYMYLCFNY